MDPSLPTEPKKSYLLYDQYRYHEKKACRVYRGYNDGEELLVKGRLYRNFRSGPVSFSENLETPDVLLKMRKTFVFSGKVDVIDNATGKLLGVATRGYKLLDENEELIGRFKGKSELKNDLGEAAASFALQILLGVEGGDTGSGRSTRKPLAFVVGDKVVARFWRTRLPFFPDPVAPREPGLVGRTLRKVLPRGVSQTLFERSPPTGWRFDVYDEETLPNERFLLPALFMIAELRTWAN